MKAKRKNLISVIISVATAIIIGGCVVFAVLSIKERGEKSTYVWYETDSFDIANYAFLTKQDNSDFKILQLADLHINVFESQNKKTYKMAADLIAQTKPDLIALTGDNVFCQTNHIFGQELIDFLDSFKIPYVLIMGNHDDQGYYDRQKMGELFDSGIYSLFEKGPNNIQGVGNYFVNIKNESGEIIYSLAMIDSNGTRYYNGILGYDYIYANQISYYKWYQDELVSFAGSKIKNLLFSHIPLPEINNVRSELKASDPDSEAFAFRENPCPPKQNTGFFEVIKSVGTTTHMFFGHDHLNVLNYCYQGVNFVYGLKTGASSYYDGDRLGGTLISIKQDLSVAVEFVYMTD